MVAEEVVVSLSGGAPWGFRLQGGAEHHKPLQVAKVRRRSKACRAGLKEDDELVAIDNHMCTEISHAQAMSLIDSQRTILHLKVKRSPSLHISSPPAASLPSRHPPSLLSPPGGGGGITSPPDSEAYYGETDSDADTQTHAQRRQRRTPPHARSPARHDSREEEETSGMSGYESATDGGVSLQGQWEVPGPGECLPGVPRRELVYEPPPAEWATPAHTPHTLTPHTLTPTPDLGLTEGEGEGDSGFQEAGGCVVLACPSLVSPEMAKGSLMLGSSRQLVPMVGLQQIPVSDELSTTYMDKARQARLHRGESVVEKQVKEARTKCRSIASLLTDAPNPNSKGVLMFKKRRQRAKKYTLTCFGKAEGDGGGETEGETEEEGGSSILSGSEVDEEGFSASYDPTWDSGYLDLLDRRSSACPSTTPTTPTTPTTNHSFPLDISTYQSPGFVNSVGQSPGLEYPGLNGSAYESSRLERGSTKQPISANAAPTSSHMSPPSMALTNGGSVVVSRASVVLSPASQSPLPNELGLQNLNMNQSPNAMGVLNRTARPFTSGPTSARSPVAPVVFRPPQPKPITVTTLTKPVAAVSMVNIPPHRQPSGQEARRAVSSTSLYISPRNNNNSYAASPMPALCSPPMHNPLSPPTSPASAAFAQPFTQINHQPQFSPQVSGQSVLYPASSAPFSSLNGPSLPPAAQGPPLYPLPPQPFSPSAPPADQPFPPPNTPVYLPPSSGISAPPHLPPQLNAPTQVYFQAQPTAPPPQPSAQAQPSPPLSFNPCTNMASALMNSTIPAPPQPPVSDSLASREQRISVPAARTGILQDARRRSNKKPMFCSVQNRDVSPNPALLSMLQNIDSHTGTVPASVGPSGDAGHESGPEEDWLRLGAEACNFMQAQRGPRPPPVAPKPQAPQLSQLEGKGGQLFARRQSRMDRYVVERSPSVAAAPYHPAQTREPSPTPSLPATWKYSSNIRAPPPISYNPLLSPSCPLKVQKPQKAEAWRSGSAKSKAGAQKGGIKPVDIMSHQPYQLSSSLFTYAGGTPQNTATSQQQQQEMMGSSQGPKKTARLYEVKRFSTPPPTATGPTLKVIMPRSATTLGEPMCRSDLVSPLPAPSPVAYQTHLPQLQPSTMPYQSQPPQWASSPLSPPPPPAPTAPLPQLPTLPVPAHIPTFSHLQSSSAVQANRQFKSTPDLSPLSPAGGPRLGSSCALPARVPRPRFSTSTLGLQPCVWRPGSNGH